MVYKPSSEFICHSVCMNRALGEIPITGFCFNFQVLFLVFKVDDLEPCLILSYMTLLA